MDGLLGENAPPWTRRVNVVALAAVLTPIGYLSYILAVRLFQGYPLVVEPLASVQMGLYALVLGLTGAVATLGWRWGLRVAPAVTLVGLLLWPWVYRSIPIGSVGYVAIPFVGVLLVTVLEGALRQPDLAREHLSGSVGRYAFAAGLLHLLAGFGLQLSTRGTAWLESFWPGSLLAWVIVAISALAIVGITAFAVALWLRRRVAAPAVLTVGWLLWGAYNAWAARDALPYGQFRGIDWISFVPAADYLLQWTPLLVAVLVFAGCELAVRDVASRYGSAGVDV